MSRHRAARLAISLLALTVLPTGLAQADREALRVGGVARFEVAAAELLGAAVCPGCVALAPAPGADVALEVLRLGPGGATEVDVVAEGRAAALASLALEVRFSGLGASGETAWRTAWLELGPAPVAAFTLPRRRDGRDRVAVVPEYRLRPTGGEEAGTHLVRIVYRVRQTGSSGAHDVVVTVPTFMSIRAVDALGTPVGSGLAFDLGRDPKAYVDAVLGRRPVSASERSFARIEVATNAPGGYRIAVTLDEIGGSAAGTERLRDRVTIAGQPAHGQVFVADRATDGYRTLIAREDFGLALDGSEPTGAHRFLITFRGTVAP